MKPIRFTVGLIAFALSAVASAATVPSTYTFTNTPVSGTYGNLSNKNNSAGWNPTNGSNYGNSIVFAANTGTAANNVTVKAYASSCSVVTVGCASGKHDGGHGGYIESASVTYYSGVGLGVTSRSNVDANGTSTGSNQELVKWADDASQPDYQHALDNYGAYESLEFAFTSAISLSQLAVGFPSGTAPDSDATVLVYIGDPGTAPPTFTARTYQDLLNSKQWAVAGNLANLSSGAGALNTTTSKYFMVGAFMGDLTVNGTSLGTSTGISNPADGNDSIKISNLGTQAKAVVTAVPEPGSIALFGIAATALFATRRRKGRKS